MTFCIKVFLRVKSVANIIGYSVFISMSLDFSAIASTPGLTYYSAQDGREIAYAIKCGIKKELIDFSMHSFLLSVPKQIEDYQSQKKIIDAYYDAADNKDVQVTQEQCNLLQQKLKKFMRENKG